MKYPLPGACAATALLLAAAPAFGQNTLRPTPKPEPAPAPTTVAESGEKRFDIELKGETAEQAVKQLVEKVGYPINVIFTGDSAGFQLPKLQLRKVTLTEFFAAIKAAGHAEEKSGRQGCEFEPVEGAANIYTFSVIEPAPNRAVKYGWTSSGTPAGPNMIGGGSTPPPALNVTQPVNTSAGPSPNVQWATAGAMVSAKAPQKTTLFFDLSKILDKTLTIEDVTTAIRTGWTAGSDGKEPDPGALKFHQESKLLIATGPPEHLEAVSSIVRLLENRRLPVKDEQERIIESMRRTIDETAQQNNRLEAKLDEAEKIKEQTVRDLRDQIAKLEIELAKRARPQ